MPGLVVHTLLGARILDRWRHSSSAAPLPADDASLAAVFLAGSIGPDMGLYPGGCRLYSDLAHYVRTTQLARALIREARSDAERAFAWGWLTHVLVDVAIHPIINIGAGEFRGRGPLTYADDPQAHLMIEIGVERHFQARWQKAGLGRLPRLPDALIGFVVRACDAVYGPVMTPADARRSFAAWHRWQGFAIALAGPAPGFNEIGRRAVKLGTGLFARRSLLHSLTHPRAASEKVTNLIEEAVEAFPDRFLDLQREGLELLPDYNLDTGAVEETSVYGPTKRTQERLNQRP